MPPSPHPSPRPTRDPTSVHVARLGERFSRSTPIPGHKEPTAVISRYVHLSLSILFICHDASLPIPPVSSSRAGALSVSSRPLRRTGAPLEHTTAECLFPICPSSSKPRSHQILAACRRYQVRQSRRVAPGSQPSLVWRRPPSQSPQTAARGFHHPPRLRPILSAQCWASVKASRRHLAWLSVLPPLPSSVRVPPRQSKKKAHKIPPINLPAAAAGTLPQQASRPTSPCSASLALVVLLLPGITLNVR